MNYVCIDIGTNSIKYNLFGSKMNLLKKEIFYIRLGEGIKNNRICTEKINKTERLIKRLINNAEKDRVKKVLIIGTSALRNCKNKTVFDRKFKKFTNTKFKILTGKEEALLSARGAIHSMAEKVSGVRVLIIDIGAGSTEIAIFENNKITKAFSIELGALSLKLLFKKKPQLTEVLSAVKEKIPGRLAKHMERSRYVLGIGGSFTTSAAIIQGIKKYAPSKIEKFCYCKKDFIDLQKKLLKKTVKDIKKTYNLHAKRADLVHYGILMINSLLNFCPAEKIFISNYGIAKGAILNYIVNEGGKLNYP